MLLPISDGIKLPIIPALDKTTLPGLCIFLAYLFLQRPIWRPRIGLVEILLGLYLLGPIVTSLLNNDPVVAGDRIIPGVGLYDAGSAVAFTLFTLMPFFVGRGLLNTESAHKQTLHVLAVAGAIYSIPLLFEIRFSPQLHAWVYGYYPSDFIQQMRDGGFRPMVFMGHGLIAATFLFLTIGAATALWRAKIRLGPLSSGAVSVYLGLVLILCKSLGATIFMVLFAPLIGFARPRLNALVAVCVVIIALSYPLLRFSGMIPTGQILELAKEINPQRSASLRVRFDNEEALLNRALERPIFGWGRYGRSRIYAEWGQDVSITDGLWVITIGQFGIVGFVAEFGLLALAVIRGAAAYRHIPGYRDKIFLTSLALLVAANIIDLIPNSSLLPMTWLFAGSLLGRAERLGVRGKSEKSSNQSRSVKLGQTPLGRPLTKVV
ncbi:hypothetical protein [Bradyrhizobium sp. CCGUVB14]|uniref:hypothetical protein n=1 Tax=Bradyrhizobium sp. CCGUVB14 TaxID=2949628 RepID=UPI0020B1D138|nr:hypothetical protein [Bradyrhizobium sp. CCGUVB14]MCP3442042.1 hypothetical protein [Bradyrhizobium sp. CCGUVB14]